MLSDTMFAGVQYWYCQNDCAQVYASSFGQVCDHSIENEFNGDEASQR